jgi:hypothetical protein
MRCGSGSLGGRADGTYAPQQFQAVEAIISLSGQHQVEGAGTQEVERLLAAGRLLNLAVVPLQETGQVSQGRGVGIDE